MAVYTKLYIAIIFIPTTNSKGEFLQIVDFQ